MNRETLDKINGKLHDVWFIDALMKDNERYKLSADYYEVYSFGRKKPKFTVYSVGKELFETFLIEQRGKLKAELKELGYEEG